MSTAACAAAPAIQYNFLEFDELPAALLYELLVLRSDVFVVEQDAVYLDPDGYDPQALHFCMRENGKLIGYARIFAPGIKFEEASIGRIVLARSHRGIGLGDELMRRGMAEIARRYDAPVRIEAQQPLQKFYNQFGFVTVSEVYAWGNLPHVQMVFTP